MASPLYIPVKEELKELKRLLRKSPAMNHPRLRMLVEMKRAGGGGISKRALMQRVGASSQSIQTWRDAYKREGLGALLKNDLKGRAGRPSLFTKEEHDRMKEKLEDPKNGLQGYIELQRWIKDEFGKNIKYNTVLKYGIRHFGSKVKVARKSHVKKRPGAVAAFKKTSATK